MNNELFTQILYGELEGHLRTSQEKLDQATIELHRQTELNEKLELDLLTMNKNSSDVPTTDNDSDVLASLSVEEKSVWPYSPSPLLTISHFVQDGPVRTTPIPFTPSAETSILPIVTSQRDRFRQRNAELEEVNMFSLKLSRHLPFTTGTSKTISNHIRVEV